MPEPKVSPKMKKGIALCEEILGIHYSGKSFNEASQFLSENLPKIEGKDVGEIRKPSEKQMNAIAIIQHKCSVEFTGSSMKDASEFISKYYDQAFGSYNKGKRGKKK